MDGFVARFDGALRAAVQRLLESDGEGFERRFIGTRHALRRHHSAAQFRDDLLPDVRVGGSVGRIHTVEREACRLHTRAVAGEAILLNERGVWNRRLCGGSFWTGLGGSL